MGLALKGQTSPLVRLNKVLNGVNGVQSSRHVLSRDGPEAPSVAVETDHES